MNRKAHPASEAAVPEIGHDENQSSMRWILKFVARFPENRKWRGEKEGISGLGRGM
jgi:hypothetical protein